MKTLAHSLLERRYLTQGATTRIIVLPLADSGLPQELLDAGQPVPLDLLSGRPVRLELDDQGMTADLCFGGPPVRCHFPWEAVMAVQDASGEFVQTLVVTVATVLEDGSLRSTSSITHPTPPQQQAAPRATPPLTQIDGARQPEATDSKPRPHLQLVTTPEATPPDRS